MFSPLIAFRSDEEDNDGELLFLCNGWLTKDIDVKSYFQLEPL